MAIFYKTGIDCIGKCGGYFVFYDRIIDSYGVVKDNGGDIEPPHCGYGSVETILKLKDIPDTEIRKFLKK